VYTKCRRVPSMEMPVIVILATNVNIIYLYIYIWTDEMDMVDHEDQYFTFIIETCKLKQAHPSPAYHPIKPPKHLLARTDQSFWKTTRKEENTVGSMKKRWSAAGEEVTGNNHIGGLGSIYLLPLAQVPKISRRICFKITPWYAQVPPRCFHCFNTLGKTSAATAKPLEDINHCFRS